MQDKPSSRSRDLPGQIVLVLQGGGALGSYQAGVYQALHEAGIEPDWVIGTSIGAINASLIAGNAPENRLARLKEFWKRMEHSPGICGPAFPASTTSWPIGRPSPTALPDSSGPIWRRMPAKSYRLGADRAAYYSTAPLENTLRELVDFGLANRGAPRLTVGAAHVGTSQMRYFDSRNSQLTVKHVMASGALPPAFPAVRIDGELYWDGGILSNSPTEAVFDDNPRRNSLIFSVHLWNPVGAEPTTMGEVLTRHKDVNMPAGSRARSSVSSRPIGCATSSTNLRHDCPRVSATIPR